MHSYRISPAGEFSGTSGEETSFPQHVNDWYNNGNTRRALSARARIFAGRQVPPVSREIPSSASGGGGGGGGGGVVAFRRSHAMTRAF